MPTPASFSWIPSTARLIVIDGFGTVPRGTLSLPPAPQVWPIKDPGDTLDYVVDISEAVAGNEGDSIAALDVAINPSAAGDLSVFSSSADGYQAIVWLTGGVSGTTYAVTITIGTNSGRVIGRTFNLPVLALAVPAQALADITDQSGAAITDQNLNPITTS